MIKKKYFSMLVGATFSSVINALLIITDTIICGIYLGDTAVSAINLVTPVYNFGIYIAMFVSLGIPILYANAMGRFKKVEADHIFGTGLTISIVGGVFIFVVLTLIKDVYLRHFMVSDTMFMFAENYYYWIRYELLLMPIAEVMVETVFADGDEFCGVTVAIVEASSNIILSIVLCRVMGVGGIGLASVIAVTLRLVVSLTHLFKKTNTLKVNLYFSFSILRKAVRYALTDAGNYLFLAVVSYILNLFVAWYFGERMIIMVSVILIVQEFQLLFDGIGEAITPIMAVYLSEKCFVGVRKVWHLAVLTCFIEGVGTILLLILLSPLLPKLEGITDPELLRVASIGIVLMTPGLVFTSYLYLLTSYYRLLDKIKLSFVISAMRDCLCIIPMVIAGAMLFGIVGAFAGTAVGAAIAFSLSMLYVYKKYGKKNLPLLLKSREEGLENYLFELEVNPERVVNTRDSVEKVLRDKGIAEKQVVRVMLLMEELLMLIYDENSNRKVLAECALIVSPEKIIMIIRDNGRQVNLTDLDRDIVSLRHYIVPGLVGEWCCKGNHLMATSFNRNCFEVSRI